MYSQADPHSGPWSQTMGVSSPHSPKMFTIAATLLLLTWCAQTWNCLSVQVSFLLLWNQALKEAGCMQTSCTAFLHSVHCRACTVCTQFSPL